MCACILNGANVYGYSKCQSDAKARFQNMAGNFITQQVCLCVYVCVCAYVGERGW